MRGIIGTVFSVARRNAIALLALFVALGGATYAATNPFVNGGGVIKGCVPKHGGALVVVKPGSRCRAGTVALPFNATGRRGRRGAQGIPGTARAWGSINRFTSGFLGPTSDNVAAVTNPANGVYCIRLDPSVDASKAVLLITPDYEHSTVFAGAIATYVYPDGSFAGCSGANALAVVTGYYSVSGTPPRASFNETNESFTFAVP